MKKQKSQAHARITTRGKILQVTPCNVELYAAFAQNCSHSTAEAVFSQVVAFALVEYDSGHRLTVPLCIDLVTRDHILVATELQFFDDRREPSSPLHYLGLSAHEGRRLYSGEVYEASQPLRTMTRAYHAWHRRFGDSDPFGKLKYASLTFKPLAVATPVAEGRHSGVPALRLLQLGNDRDG